MSAYDIEGIPNLGMRGAQDMSLEDLKKDSENEVTVTVRMSLYDLDIPKMSSGSLEALDFSGTPQRNEGDAVPARQARRVAFDDVV